MLNSLQYRHITAVFDVWAVHMSQIGRTLIILTTVSNQCTLFGSWDSSNTYKEEHKGRDDRQPSSCSRLPARGKPKGIVIGNNVSKGQNKGQALANKRQLTCFPASMAIHEVGLASKGHTKGDDDRQQRQQKAKQRARLSQQKTAHLISCQHGNP